MATFPALSSGAIAQYPMPAYVARTTQVVRFLDGSDQRCIVRARPVRWWVVKLSLLNDVELALLEGFFTEEQGGFGLFDFPDPFSGQTITNCRLATSALETLYEGPDQGSTELTIMECYE
ncbi:MAG: hypothetical protein WBW33_14560 [Bryobacteraceae bacterium]